MPIAYDPDDEWHVSVDLMLMATCDTCYADFESPTLGLITATGDDAAVVATEAQSQGWQLVRLGIFRCPACAAKAP